MSINIVKTLKLEAIGDDYAGMLRLFGVKSDPWVAEITGKDPTYKFERHFLQGQKDYSEANSVGSRGVYLYYYLVPGKVYEINDPVTWKRWDRYFAWIDDDGNLNRATEGEVLAWLESGGWE